MAILGLHNLTRVNNSLSVCVISIEYMLDLYNPCENRRDIVLHFRLVPWNSAIFGLCSSLRNKWIIGGCENYIAWFIHTIFTLSCFCCSWSSISCTWEIKWFFHYRWINHEWYGQIYKWLIKTVFQPKPNAANQKHLYIVVAKLCLLSFHALWYFHEMANVFDWK